MRILLIHTYYQRKGGEDFIFEREHSLLVEKGHEVDTLIFKNDVISSPLQQVLAGIRSIYNWEAARQLEEKIQMFEPDVIHVYNFFPLASPSIFYVAKKNKVPIVVNIQNYRLICPGALLFYDGKIYEDSIHKLIPWDAIRKGVYRNSSLQTAAVVATTALHKVWGTWRQQVTKFVVPTEFAKAKLLHSSLNVREEQFYVKPNFTFDLGSGLPARDNYFIFVGRLDKEKGVSVLLEAVSRGGFNLEIIGDGPERSTVEKAGLLNDRITYHGLQDQSFISNRLKKAKAMIFPSVWYEGLPMTILEALSTGTPVIASNLGGPAEVIDHEYNGLLFQPGNTDELISMIDRLLTDELLHATLLLNARQSYEEKYSSDVVYKSQIHLYESVISDAANSTVV